MSECKCLVAKYVFRVWLKSTHWWHNTIFCGIDHTYPKEEKIITIHGDSLNEIENKKDELKNEIFSKYDGNKYSIYVGVLD